MPRFTSYLTVQCVIGGVMCVALITSPTLGANKKATIPNFSGIWSHPFLTGFERVRGKQP